MRTEIAPFKSECLQKHGKTNSPAMRQTPREAHHGAPGAHGPYFLCSAPCFHSPTTPASAGLLGIPKNWLPVRSHYYDLTFSAECLLLGLL